MLAPCVLASLAREVALERIEGSDRQPHGFAGGQDQLRLALSLADLVLPFEHFPDAVVDRRLRRLLDAAVPVHDPRHNGELIRPETALAVAAIADRIVEPREAEVLVRGYPPPQRSGTDLLRHDHHAGLDRAVVAVARLREKAPGFVFDLRQRRFDRLSVRLTLPALSSSRNARTTASRPFARR